jgi:hypothetical protein
LLRRFTLELFNGPFDCFAASAVVHSTGNRVQVRRGGAPIRRSAAFDLRQLARMRAKGRTMPRATKQR